GAFGDRHFGGFAARRFCYGRCDRRAARVGPRASWRGIMLKELQEFIARGNVIDLAVGIIIGAAFTGIVDSVVNDLIMPFFGAIGGVDFSNYFFPLSSNVTAVSLEEARKQGAVFAYGNFITVLINFL